MIISMHTPKAGGSSFKELLQHHFGRSFRGDYRDIPMNRSLEERTRAAMRFDRRMNGATMLAYKLLGVQCIHGHFLPYKYRKLLGRGHVFITWLRDPTERLISHYHYWKRSYTQHSAPLQKKVVEEDWSLERFCLSEEMQNLYGKFLWNFPIENFDFIGITEHFDTDIAYFARTYLGIDGPIEPPRSNVNPDRQGDYSREIDPGLLEAIRTFHAEDYALYGLALEKRRARLSTRGEGLGPPDQEVLSSGRA